MLQSARVQRRGWGGRRDFCIRSTDFESNRGLEGEEMKHPALSHHTIRGLYGVRKLFVRFLYDKLRGGASHGAATCHGLTELVREIVQKMDNLYFERFLPMPVLLRHFLFGYFRSLQIRETRLSRDVCGTCREDTVATFVSPQYVFEMMFSARSLTKQ